MLALPENLDGVCHLTAPCSESLNYVLTCGLSRGRLVKKLHSLCMVFHPTPPLAHHVEYGVLLGPPRGRFLPLLFVVALSNLCGAV